MLLVAQETAKKKSADLEQLKNKTNVDNAEVTRLIDLLAITFNSFKLVNDKNMLVGNLKKSLANT